MKGFSRVAVCLFVCCLTVTLSAARTYKETDGLVIMEIENTESPLGEWVLKTDNPGYNGDGFLEFTGNEITNGPPKSPLEFRFRISEAGIYSIKLRARKRLDGAESDLCNDCYVRVEGDYTSGSDKVTLRALQNDTKLYGGPANGWGWAGNLDAHDADHTQAKYDFKAGEEYLLVVSGRSKRYQIDRIVFVHSSANLSDAESGPESPLVEDTNPVDDPGVSISGELKKWHKVTLTLTGPEASESGNPNPFTDYRMDVTFTNGSSSLTVPGYFAADGDAANSGASSGNTWRAHLCPDKTGTWNYSVSFMEGANCAVNGGGTALSPFDGIAGSFVVAETDKSGRDMRAKGWLQYTGERYLRFKGSGEYFLKQGADAPENFLAYEDFDGPFKSDGRKDNLVKSWSAHVTDWNDGDPAWNGNKGKGIIGAINYLASEGMNVFSFLPMNIGGDDRNVFPYLDYDERYRMDCSRLDQWAIVFEHGTKMGMFLHFKTQETENELLLDGGDLGAQRKLYYRELIARFAHNPALNWNLGEENNDQSDKQRKAMAQYFHDNDPYGHHIVIHTYPGGDDNIYTPLLGSNSKLTGPSLQLSSSTFSDVHARVCEWVDKSANAGKPWAVAVDEPGDAGHALRPDNDAGSSHEDGRKNALWGTFLAGGWGTEWYFGYQHDHSDLTCEDFRSRDQWWDYCRYALEFFHHNAIPFHEMVNDNGLSSADNDYCFYKEGEVYVIYLKNGGTTNLDLGAAQGSFQVRWYDPRNGGSLRNGSVSEVAGGGEAALGNAPSNTGKDWVILVTSYDPDLPGTLAFGTSDFTAAENAGSATITVTRTGGTSGEVSVDYATSDGTAEAGQDYTATSGTLVLGDGTSSATFEIPVNDDQDENGSRTVNLTLSNPGGGAELGTPTEAVLTIADNEGAAEPQQWTFDTDTEGWVYVDDAFRSTSRPDQAAGTHTGEALKVTIGGAASGSDGGISGGWEKEFTVDTDARLSLSFDYQLTNTRFDDDEYTEVLVMFDGALVGTGGNDYVEHLAGREELAWKKAEIDLGTVSSGTRTLTIGLYNNKRTTVEEQGDLVFDNVSITSDRQTVAPGSGLSGTAVFEIQTPRLGSRGPSLLLSLPAAGTFTVTLYQLDGRLVYRHEIRAPAGGAHRLALPAGLSLGGSCIARLSGKSMTISRVVPMIR